MPELIYPIIVIVYGLIITVIVLAAWHDTHCGLERIVRGQELDVDRFLARFDRVEHGCEVCEHNPASGKGSEEQAENGRVARLDEYCRTQGAKQLIAKAANEAKESTDGK